MAAQTNRQVTLTLKAQTDGAQSVRDLAEEIRKLAKKGGEATPEFEKLSKELDQLAQQQGLVTSFNEVTTAVAETRTAMSAAKTAADGEKASLDALTQTLNTAKQAQADHAAKLKLAETAVDNTRNALNAAKTAVAQYNAEIGGARGATQEQAATMNRLRQAVRDATAEHKAAKETLDGLKPVMRELNAEVSKSQAEFNAQNREVKAAEAAVARLKEEYDALTTALQATEKDMAGVGLDTAKVTEEQNRLTQAMARLTQEADRLKSSLAAPGQEAMTAAQRIEQAFGIIGVKSVSATKAEILRVNTALMTLARDANISGAEFDRAFAAGKARIAELEQQLEGASGKAKGFGGAFTDALKQFGPATVVFNLVTGAINTMVNAAHRVPEITAQFESMHRALKVITGSTEGARKEFEYIQRVANHVGTDVNQLGDAYIKLTASTKDTVLEGTQAKRVFEAVAGAMGTLGSSASETEFALQAVSQMVSKGVVSMEEFRQQLSERLPGAFQVTAKELGITTSELNTLVSSGKLTAEYVLPALAAGLEKMYQTQKKNDTLRGQWAEISNAIKGYSNALGESFLPTLTKIGRASAAVLVAIPEMAANGVKALSVLASATWARDFSMVAEVLTGNLEATDQRLKALAGTAKDSNASIAQMAKDAKAAGQEFVVMADGTKIATDSILHADDGLIKFLVTTAKAVERAEGLATSAHRAAEAIRASGESSTTAANALGNEIEKRRVATEVAKANADALEKVTAAERVVLTLMEAEAERRAIAMRDAKQVSDASRETLVKLGDEIAKRRVVVDGYARQAEAARILAEAQRIEAQAAQDNAGRLGQLRQRYLELVASEDELRAAVIKGTATEVQLNVVREERRKVSKLLTDALGDEGRALQETATISGNEKQVRDANIQAIQLQLDALRDLGQSRSDEAVRLERQLELAKVERQALEDNSKSVYTLQEAYERTKAAVAELTAAKATGKDVTVQLAAAELEAAKATALYKDALRDQQEVIKATSTAKQAQLSLEETETKLGIERMKTVVEVARAKGDEAAVTDALNSIKSMEIQLARLQAEAKRAEANAIIAAVRAKRLELEASGQLTPAKKAELEAQEASAKAKKVEADIADEAANRIAQLADATRQAGESAAESADGYDRLAQSIRGVSSAASSAKGAMSGLLMDDKGFTSRQGGLSFASLAYQRGYSPEQVKAAEQYFGELLKQNMATQLTGNLGDEANYQYQLKLAMNDAVDRAVRQAMKNGDVGKVAVTTDDLVARNIATTDWQRAGATPGGGELAMRTAVTTAGQEARQRSMTVNVNLGGKRTAVNVASERDATALTSIFRQLENDALRAT